MRRFTGLSYSPWSEKARWALDHHRITYKYEEHLPLVGEVKLRLRMRKPTGMVTVPVLQDGSTWRTDSFDIAKEADRAGSGARLFPEGQATEIEMWNRRSEAGLSAGRALAVLAFANEPDAALPPLLRPLLRPVARAALEAFASKYRMREGAKQHERVLTETLSVLEAALAEKGGQHLVGNGLSYADIAMAVVVQFVSPVDVRYMPSGPPGTKPFKNAALAARFSSLVAWRDNLYSKHRPLVPRRG